MNNLRRTLSLLLALVMLVALGAFASAEDSASAETAVILRLTAMSLVPSALG